MTGDDQRDGVVAQRRTNRSNRLRATDLCGDPAVGPNLAPRDLLGLRPDRPLELGPMAEVEVDTHPAVAGDPPLERSPETRGHRRRGTDGAARFSAESRLERRWIAGRRDRR